LPVDGFSASWCGQLYQYLGFLPSSPFITDALNLLNWLRTTARILPHQPPEKVRELQVEACTQWHDFFQRWSSVAPPVSPEQIFYEDLEWSAGMSVPEKDLDSWKQHLRKLFSQRPQVPLSLLHRRMLACWNLHFSGQEDVDFTTFCRVFLSEGSEQGAEGSEQKAEGGRQGEEGGGQETEGSEQWDETVPLGVLMQPFFENGQWMTVVNGLFVGGGKLAARWLHLFPPAERERLEQWHKTLKLDLFPSQGWYNANFQPQPQNRLLRTPGARWKQQTNEIRLGDIRVRLKGPGLELRYPDGSPVFFTDLGLEAPETRPPAMQLLYHLTVPTVGIRTLIPDENWSEISPGLRHRSRVVHGNMIFARQAWSVDEKVWKSWTPDHEHQALVYRHLCTVIRSMGRHRYFFYNCPGEKPQMADLHSPLLMQVFEKDLRHGSGTLLITEMLPTPAQAGERAWELVVDPV
ncbi:MAG: hypothetical protein IT270_05680, partial [Saprospiraceae bacterium]|nr:hypothetical protein [Saprospiraceae bacterium]